MASSDSSLEEAQTLYEESMSAMRDQRKQIAEDLKFSDPSDPQQWDELVKAQRESDPGGKRPCLVHDQTGQYTAQVTGQIEKQPPSIHAIPVGGGADKQAAEQIDGRFRHIEHASRASLHYATALTSAARAGVGYLIIRPDYVNRALGWQEPRISSEGDPLKVVYDPWSVETDGADSDFGFILTPISSKSFDKKWKGHDAVSFGDTEGGVSKDDRDSILLAEQWLKTEELTPTIVYLDEDGNEATTDVTPEEFNTQMQMSGAKIQYLRTYKAKATKILWRRMSGVDVLEESQYPADSIGIVPVYGYVGFKDGRMTYCGIPRRARMPQQSYNYHASELMMPGAQLLASKRAMAGVEPLWDKAHVERRAYLPFNDFDTEGQVSPPTMIKVGSGLVDHGAACERAKMDIQAAVGMYQANIGAPSNETSGVAIDARKEQGESSTAHFPSHMAASLGQVGQIVMQMDAKLADTRRKQPIMGVNGTAGSITVDPDQGKAFQRNAEGVTINPNVGQYGVRVVVGASYTTQRSQTNAAFAEIMRGNKELSPVVAPFWAQTLDFPDSDKFAQAMAAMAPPAVKAILQPEDGNQAPDPALLAQQLAECKQALNEAIQHAKDAQQDADEAVSKEAAAKQDNANSERELNIEAYNAETERIKVTGANVEQMQAIVKDLITEMLEHPDPLPGDGEPLPPEAAEPAEPAAPAEPAEPPPPQPPSPELQALVAGHANLTDAVGKMAEAISKPRVRIPVRDKSGAITHVVDKTED